MNPLRRRMIEDMQIRNLAAHTQRVYVEQLVRFARYFRYHVASATRRVFSGIPGPFILLTSAIAGESGHGRAACHRSITQQTG